MARITQKTDQVRGQRLGAGRDPCPTGTDSQQLRASPRIGKTASERAADTWCSGTGTPPEISCPHRPAACGQPTLPRQPRPTPGRMGWGRPPGSGGGWDQGVARARLRRGAKEPGSACGPYRARPGMSGQFWLIHWPVTESIRATPSTGSWPPPHAWSLSAGTDWATPSPERAPEPESSVHWPGPVWW